MKKEKRGQTIENNIDNIINDAMSNLKSMVDSNVVIGKPTTLSDKTVIIPVSKVLVGIVCGGSEIGNNKKSNTMPFAGGTGAGYTLVPIGILSGKNGNFNFVPIEQKNIYSELLVTANDILNKINKESKWW